MEVVTTVAALRERVRSARRRGETVGLVPTMGALHAGHLSLMQRAAAECGFVVASLFVNPTQFAPTEDLSRYPRDPEGDRAMAADAGVDILFAPAVEEVYPAGASTYVVVEEVSAGMEGASRPTHFRGVATVVAKLFNMAQPDRAYFGEKDYQQLQVIRRMTRDLGFPVEIVPCATVREPDGLAMSSRNRYLSPEERAAALALSRGLDAARRQYDGGERRSGALVSAARTVLDAEQRALVDYVELVDADDLTPVENASRPVVLAIAAFVGSTRLIDNTVLGRAPSPGAPARPGSV